jgi:GDP-D-mannose 3', 5'-epimerase
MKKALVFGAGPLGMRARNSDNRLIEKKIGWKPTQPLLDQLEITYRRIRREVEATTESP